MADYQLSKTGAEIDAALDLAVEHETSKADIDGNYPDLTSGEAIHSTFSDFASQIETDREIDDAEEACPPIVFGTVGGNAEVQSGLMKFPELRGHTIKWNQLINPADIPSTRTINGITFTNNGDGTVTVSGTATASAYISIMSAVGKKIVGHKYLLRGCPVGGNASNGYRMFDNGESPYKYDVGDGVIYTAAVADDGGIYISVSSGTVISTPITFKPNYFDITDIYGAGNEPSTVAEFARSYPWTYYEYSARTLHSSKSSALLSIGRNQWDEEWEVGTINDTTGEEETASDRIRSKNFFPVLPDTVYFANCGGDYYLYPYFYDAHRNFIGAAAGVKNNTFTIPSNALWMRFNMQNTYGTTYNNDICIYINWDTPNLPYVKYQSQEVELPNIELRSAGAAYDVAYQTGGGKRRIGSVDLGTLIWSYNATNEVFFATVPGMKEMYSPTVAKNVLCSVYPTSQSSLANLNDKSITASYLASPNDVAIKDTGYSSADAFKTAMSGVVLYYELASETDITTSENAGWDEYLPIDNFGMLIFYSGSSQEPQVPQAYFIRYTVNLVEFLDSVGEKAGWDADAIALKSDIVIPEAPTTDGTYTLKVTVLNGTPTYSWIAG